MNRLIGLVFLAALVVPSAASAAPLNELPFQPRADRGFTGCLEATGAPGRLAVLGPVSRTRSATDVLTASGQGAALAERVEVGRLLACAAVAEAPGGAAIVAGETVRIEGGAYRRDLRAAIREPGAAAVGAPVTLGEAGADPAVAIAPDGRAVVAWGERTGGRTRVVAARRDPGGGFGPPQTLASWRSDFYSALDISAAADAGGTFTVLWAYQPSNRERVEVATAAPGAAFAVQRLSGRADYGAAPVMAVAPDGWTVVAFELFDSGRPAVFERAPGAERFSAVALPAPPPDESLGSVRGAPAVAVRSGGGAVLAWTTGPFDSMSGVDAMTRETAGAFTARRVAEPVRKSVFSEDELDIDILSFLEPLDWPPVGSERAELGVALDPAGRVLLAWPAPAGRRPLATLSTRAAVGRLDGGFEAPRTIGAAMREVRAIAPLFLDDGRAAVAWLDNASRPGHGRLHLAVEGAAAATPEAPRLTLRARRFQRLFSADPLRVTARCEAACDLRATVLGPGGSRGDTPVTSLRRGPIRLRPSVPEGIGPGRPRMVRVVVHATAPGGRATTVRSLRVRVARRPAPPVRAPRDVRARRRGDSIVVTWRTAGPARRQTFFVFGRESRDDDDPELGAYAVRHGRGRRSFAVRLEAADGLRWVTVLAEGYDSGGVDGPTKTVRVR